MIDYHAHTIALTEARQALAAATFADPTLLSARSQTQGDLSVASNHALLGTVLDQIFTHAVSDGSELALLTRAADLWKSGVDLYNSLASVRGRMETALGNPADPNSVSDFNSAAADVQFFAQSAYALQAQITSLRDEIGPLTYLTAHPRQIDQPSGVWDWGNRLLGRRTDAFVRSLNRLAHDSPTRAFAFGALTGYAANAAGSAYLGFVVGGPRRSHRFRDRVARNAMGSWLARAYPTASPSPGQLAQFLRFGSATNPTLPSGVADLLRNALKETFDLSKTPAPPDLQLGYSRMLEHLKMLENFVRPPIPDPPAAVWLAKLYGDPSNPPPSLRTQDIGPAGDPGGGVSLGSNGTGGPSPGQSDNSKSSDICGIIMAILIIVDLVQAFVQCIGQWANKHKCTFWDNMLLKKLWEKDPPDPRDPQQTNVGVSSSQLTAMASSDEITQFVGCLFDIHIQLWEGLDRAYNFLAFHGLIYPGSLIDVPVYSQFTTLTLAAPWPHRPVDDAIDWYHLYPFSPIENPAGKPPGFASGSRPDAFLPLAIQRFTLPLWEQIVRSETDSQNLDLDADRGFMHPCWATVGSINDDPVNVGILAYGAQ